MSLLSKIFGKPSNQLAQQGNRDDGWVLADRKSDSGISLIRIKKLPSSFKFANSKFRLSILWSYQKESDTGAPSSAEVERMERFELLVRQHIEMTGAALLAIIFTEAQFRQYEFYTGDVKRFINLLNKIPAQSEPFPIEIREEKDEEGDFYYTYANGILGDP